MSMDKNVNRNKEQGHSEGQGEKRKSGQAKGSGASSSEIERINKELAKPNVTAPARKALEDRKRKLGG